MNTLIIVCSILFVVCCISVRGDSSTAAIQLGTVNAPMVAYVDLNSFSRQIQTYVDHVIHNQVAAILAEKTKQAVNEAVTGIAANITSSVIKAVKGYSSLNVMFHAIRSSSIYLGYHDVIVFDHVQKNVGGGYDGKSGKFTATIKGLYMFSTRVDTIQGKHMHIALVKNGEITSVAWALHDTATITEPLILLPGDKVWVWHNRHSKEYVYRANTIFGGTLIRRF